jgi:hypothetical protein
MKDIIIGAIAHYTPEKIAPYVNSIARCGFTGNKIMVVYNVPDSTVLYLHKNGWEVIAGELSGHPHMKRLVDIYSVLRDLNRDYRYVITTDVRDVVFQRNPSEYLESNLKKRILVSSENVLYKDEPWGTKNIFEGYGQLGYDRYKDEVSCNVGVLAGYYTEMVDLLLLNYLVSQAGNTTHYTDQSSFNFIIHNALVKDSIQIVGQETDWALQVGTMQNSNLIGNKAMYIDKDGMVWHTHTPYVIVHQYDRHALMQTKIQEKYGAI